MAHFSEPVASKSVGCSVQQQTTKPHVSHPLTFSPQRTSKNLCADRVFRSSACIWPTGRTLFLTPGTPKLPHPNGTQGYPRPNGSCPRNQILFAHWCHTIVGLANKIFKVLPLRTTYLMPSPLVIKPCRK